MRRSHMVLSGGRTVDVVEVGPVDGTPVVLFHGTPSGPLEAVLSEASADVSGVRIICPGRPGYAASSPAEPGLSVVVADTREIVARLGLRRWAVAGISGGGPYAAAVAATLREDVAALAVLAGSGPPREGSAADGADGDEVDDDRLLALAAAGDRAAAGRGLAAAMASWVESIRGRRPDPMPQAIHDAILDATADGLDGYVFDRLSTSLPWDVDLSSVACPTELVYGEADANCPPALGDWYLSRIPHASLTVVPGADHATAIRVGTERVLPILAALV